MFTLEQPGVFLQKEILHCYKCLLSLAKIVFTCQRFCCTPLSSTLNKKSCRVTRLNNHTVDKSIRMFEFHPQILAHFARGFFLWIMGKRLKEHICKRDHDAHKEFSAKGMRNAQAPGWSKLRAPLFLVGDSWIEAAVGNGLNERNHAKLLTAAVFAKVNTYEQNEDFFRVQIKVKVWCISGLKKRFETKQSNSWKTKVRKL